jgi:hypothetical protein
MTLTGKVYVVVLVLVGLAGAFAHDFLGFSKVTIVVLVILIGAGLISSLLYSNRA